MSINSRKVSCRAYGSIELASPSLAQRNVFASAREPYAAIANASVAARKYHRGHCPVIAKPPLFLNSRIQIASSLSNGWRGRQGEGIPMFSSSIFTVYYQG